MPQKPLASSNSFLSEKLEANQILVWGIMLGIVLLNFLVKGWHITHRDIWLDEAFTIFYAQTTWGNLLEALARDSNPPLHNILMKFWVSIFGTGQVAVRIPSLLFALGSAGLLFRLAHKYFNLETALIASFFFLFSHPHLMQAQNCRSYEMSSFLVLCSFNLYLDWFEKQHVLKFLGLMVLSWAIIMTHYSNFLIFLGQGLISFYWFREKKKAFWGYWASQLLAVILFLPWVWLFFSAQADAPVTHPFRAGKWGDLSRIPGALIANKTVWWSFLGLLIPGMVLWWKQIRSNLDRNHRFSLWLILSWGFLSLLVAWVLSPVSSFFEVQYLLMLSFSFWLILGYLWSAVRFPRWVKLVLLLFFCVVGVWDFSFKPTRNENWRELKSMVQEWETGGEFIGISPHFQTAAGAYHLRPDCFHSPTDSAMFDCLEKERFFSLYDGPEPYQEFYNRCASRSPDRVILIQLDYKTFDPGGSLPKKFLGRYRLGELRFFKGARVVVVENR